MSDSVLLIGCGKQAEKHISGLKFAGVEDIFLFDQVSEVAEQLAAKTGLTTVSDLDAAFADPSINAVDICTPTGTHAELIAKAFSNEKHAFCEKPLCKTFEEAEALLKLSEETGLKCGIGYIYRFAPVFEELHRILREKDEFGNAPMGQLVSANMRIGGRGSHAVWKHRKETDGGAVNEMLVHMVDLAIWLFGKCDEFELTYHKLLRSSRVIQGVEVDTDAEDYVVARGRFGEVEVLFQADMLTPEFSQIVSLQGTNGSFLGSIQPQIPSHVYFIDPVGAFDGGVTPLAFPPSNLFEKQMVDFMNFVRHSDSDPRCPLNQAASVIELIQSAQNTN